jgi:hypothetical protein
MAGNTSVRGRRGNHRVRSPNNQLIIHYASIALLSTLSSPHRPMCSMESNLAARLLGYFLGALGLETLRF